MRIAILLALALLAPCFTSAQALAPPVAKVVPHELEAHGQVRTDNYYWLKERDNPDVVHYLEAENAYLDRMMGHTKGLQDALFREITGRIKKDDDSVPYHYHGDYYYRRYEQDEEYPIYCRKKGSPEGQEEVLVDADELAKGFEFFSIRITPFSVSPSGATLAFAVDTVGRRFYTVRFKNLVSGALYEDEIRNVTGNGVWANDGKTYFYTKQHPETLRWYRVYRHVVGTDPTQDVLVYEEKDETFGVSVLRTKSERYVMIGSSQTLSTEYRLLDANEPQGDFTVIQPRERDHEYFVDHQGDRLTIRTNWNATNFRLMETQVTSPTKEHWKETVPHREDVLLGGFELFDDYLVLEERKDGLNQLRVRPRSGEEYLVDFGEPTYLAFIDINLEADTPTLRYTYTSLTTPWSTYDYDMSSRQKTLLKREEVVGGYDPSDYTTDRLWATARDGTRVPISIVYSQSFEKNGTRPLLLYGYGSYGYSLDPVFESALLSLLDRGFAFAIAHVRGGEEMGREWYERGKLLDKKNTFTDFIDCAKFLVEEGYSGRDRLFAVGGSAGGLLMGAVVNMAPELFKGVVAEVPFVDVVTTMLDPDIPLTASEYDEWGDPNKKDYYDYMLSYSPYDNVVPKTYPNLLVTTGYHDSQVQYWEPAKWVAKLRAIKTDENLLLLKTNMEAGHGGPSGRFRYHRQTALEYAFFLDLAGITE
ncbi:MAG TPA: S9 family peptidase [Vicinamibacteria bacterium]|nr:S9 family peptidase [Vicinamibacteria bacterium]